MCGLLAHGHICWPITHGMPAPGPTSGLFAFVVVVCVLFVLSHCSKPFAGAIFRMPVFGPIHGPSFGPTQHPEPAKHYGDNPLEIS